MFGIGHTELIIVGVIALLVFGGNLPNVARSLGKSLTEFKRGLQGMQDEFNDAAYATREAARQVDYTLSHEDDPDSPIDALDDSTLHKTVAPELQPPTAPPQREA